MLTWGRPKLSGVGRQLFFRCTRPSRTFGAVLRLSQLIACPPPPGTPSPPPDSAGGAEVHRGRQGVPSPSRSRGKKARNAPRNYSSRPADADRHPPPPAVSPPSFPNNLAARFHPLLGA